MTEEFHTRPRTKSELLAAVLVALITLAFGAFGAIILYAKWQNFDSHLLDFAKAALYDERLIQGVPFSYKIVYYSFFYSAFNSLLLPFYMIFRSVSLFFVVHLVCFTLAIPLLYRIARQNLVGVTLPLAVVVGYALNPSINMLVIGIMRLEALWLICFLLTIYFVNAKRPNAALTAASIGCILRMDGIPAFFLLGLTFILTKRSAVGRRIMTNSIVVFVILSVLIVVFRLISGISPSLNQLHLNNILGSAEGSSIFNNLKGAASSLLNLKSYAHLAIALQLLLLPLFAPAYLLPAAFSVLYVVVSSESFYAIPEVRSLAMPNTFMVPSIHSHDTFILPIFFVAMIYGVRTLYSWLSRLCTTREKFLATIRGFFGGALILSFFFVHWFYATPYMGPIPLTPHFNWDYYRQTPHSRLAWRMLDRLPKDVPGFIQFSFAERNDKYLLAVEVYPTTEITPQTQYALFDLYAFSANMPKEKLLEKIRDALTRKDFYADHFEDGIILLKRGEPNEKNKKILDYIDENWDWLSKNLDNPYRYNTPSH